MHLNNNGDSKLKVRLAAIAKDEAAYLPAWIFHHLKFGFDDIEIYVNNTTDGSLDILKKIAENHPVKLILADYMFDEPKCTYFQKYAYEDIYKNSIFDDVDYLLFLDIDEFWTPVNFTDSIHDCLRELHEPDIISFEWVLKRNENSCFSSPYSFSNEVNKNHHTKSIFKTSLRGVDIKIHNVDAIGANNILADGSAHPFPHPHSRRYGVDDYNINYTPIKKYFILHRLWRSQLEYIHILGQGYRQVKHKDNEVELNFKLNRDGYMLPENRTTAIDFYGELIDKYDADFQCFVDENEIACEIEEAKAFIVESFYNIIDKIVNHKDDNEKLKRALRCVNLEEAKQQAVKVSEECQAFLGK